MDLGLKDKVALVTGAGSQIGYGKGIALVLAKEGCDVIVADIDFEGAKKTAADVEALGRKAIAIKVDISNEAEVKALVKAGLDKFGKIDILVNNAGKAQNVPFLDCDEKSWHINIDINLKGMWYLIMEIIPQMIKRKSGKIINLSSGAARIGFPNASLYCAGKAGVIGLTRALAAEFGPSGINVNGICPGIGDTNMTIDSNTPRSDLEAFAANAPMRRLTTPQDIGNAVAFLVSDVSSDITGQTINVDSGYNRL